MKKILFSCLLSLGLLATASSQVVITELMYNPPGPDTLLEYLEIHNRGNTAVDISNWTFTGITYTFPAGTSFPAGGYIVICANASQANLATLGVSNPRIWTNSALTNTGEKIELFNGSGASQDVVEYGVATPWPPANNTGASMVLCDPASDNSLPSSWAAATTATTITLNNIAIKCNPGAAGGCTAGPPATFPLYTINKVTGENATTGVADSVNVDCTLEGVVYGVNLRGNFGLQFFIGDNTGGIALFNQNKSFGYTVTQGDRVQVKGYIAQFNGLTQLALDTVIKLSANNALNNAAVVAKPVESTESTLIRINGLTLLDPAAWDSTGNPAGFTVLALKTGTQDTVTIRVDNNTTLYAQPVPPQPFDVTGIGSQFDSSNPFTGGYQILPRYTEDISTLVSTREIDLSAYVKLSPNPTSDYALIEMTQKVAAISLISPTGQVLQRIKNPQDAELLPLRHLAAGTYMLRFEQGNASWSTRLVVLR